MTLKSDDWGEALGVLGKDLTPFLWKRDRLWGGGAEGPLILSSYITI